MKISILTVCFNSEKTIADTINSVNSQTYKNIEHIFVDGGSEDNTIKILKKILIKKIIYKKKTSIYEAMNEGIKRASGIFIMILNSDDILNSNTIIEETVKKIKKNPRHDVFLGNVIYFSFNNYNRVKRFYEASNLRVKNLLNGDMPPHPASFKKKYMTNMDFIIPNLKLHLTLISFLGYLKNTMSNLKF